MNTDQPYTVREVLKLALLAILGALGAYGLLLGLHFYL